MYNSCLKHSYNGLGLLIDHSCIEHFHDVRHVISSTMIDDWQNTEFKVSTRAEMTPRLTESAD